MPALRGHVARGMRPLVDGFPVVKPGGKAAIVHAPDLGQQAGLQLREPLAPARAPPLPAEKIERAPVRRHHGRHVLGAAQPALDFQAIHARAHQLLDQRERAKIFRAEHVVAPDRPLLIGIVAADGVLAPAGLRARATVGRFARAVLREKTASAHRHAHRAVGKHLDLHRLGGATAQPGPQLALDAADIGQRTLARQHEAPQPERVQRHDGRRVAHRHLRGGVDLQPQLARHRDHGPVGGDHTIDPGLVRGGQQRAHPAQLRLVDERVGRQVGAHTARMAPLDDLGQLAHGKVFGPGAHVKPGHAEIDGIGPRIQRRGEVEPVTGRREQFGECLLHESAGHSDDREPRNKKQPSQPTAGAGKAPREHQRLTPPFSARPYSVPIQGRKRILNSRLC